MLKCDERSWKSAGSYQKKKKTCCIGVWHFSCGARRPQALRLIGPEWSWWTVAMVRCTAPKSLKSQKMARRARSSRNRSQRALQIWTTLESCASCAGSVGSVCWALWPFKIRVQIKPRVQTSRKVHSRLSRRLDRLIFYEWFMIMEDMEVRWGPGKAKILPTYSSFQMQCGPLLCPSSMTIAQPDQEVESRPMHHMITTWHEYWHVALAQGMPSYAVIWCLVSGRRCVWDAAPDVPGRCGCRGWHWRRTARGIGGFYWSLEVLEFSVSWWRKNPVSTSSAGHYRLTAYDGLRILSDLTLTAGCIITTVVLSKPWPHSLRKLAAVTFCDRLLGCATKKPFKMLTTDRRFSRQTLLSTTFNNAPRQ